MYIERLLHDWKEDCLSEQKEQIEAVIDFYDLKVEDLAQLGSL